MPKQVRLSKKSPTLITICSIKYFYFIFFIFLFNKKCFWGEYSFKKANSNEFNPSYEDYNCIERNKVLSDLSHSKILLQKTSYISPISHASKYEPTQPDSHHDFFATNNIQYTHPAVGSFIPKLKNIDFEKTCNTSSNTDLVTNSFCLLIY